MTEDNKNTTRLKLTLKLKPADAAAPTTPKIEQKKHSSSAVQVTIKGRKKEVKNEETTSSLSKSEMEARIKAISGLQKTSLDNEDKKISVNKLIAESIEAEAPPVQEEIIVEEKKIEEKPVIVPNKNYNLDTFDVRNKIKQSLEVTNRERQEREKHLELRKKAEKEKLEKEKLEKERKKPKKVEEDREEKKKSGFKEEKKVNVRRLTYFIGDSDEDEFGSARRRKKKHRQEQVVEQKEYKKVAREVALPELITVADLAERMSEKAGDVVKKLFSMGTVATSNQVIDADTAEILVAEFGHTAKRVSHSDVENVLEETNENIELKPRAPIVTIMGHVDHGKTSLLDALRETTVVEGEHGGITQHIGASRVKTKDGKYITFLDTPGHEAFTEMRSRGANITDIVVLVVAADDGVKEQTIEAISHAKAANVPIIVAVNKIDKPGGDPERVKHELLTHHIVSEDLGGDVMFVPVSAKSKINLDKLEEAILLQAEVLELKAPYEGKSSGVVLESRIDPAKGVIATLLVQKGTLDTSDIIVVGTSYGRVRKLTDDKHKHLQHATPSMAVEVMGLDSAPSAGDKFVEVSEERQAREIISYRARKEKEEKAMKNSAKSMADIFKSSSDSKKLRVLNVVIKSDVHGSAEAIQGSLVKLNNEEVAVKVIHLATGGITESDVNLAAVSNAIIIGFNVRANLAAKEVARVKNVDIRYYSIIYNLVDDLKLLLSGMLDPTKNEEYLGQAEIRQVFKISGIGKIAGAFITDGLIKRNAKVRLLRDNVVIHDGILKTLKRFKDDVKEVKSGFECGIAFENYEDIKEKDTLECYEIVEQKRTL